MVARALAVLTALSMTDALAIKWTGVGKDGQWSTPSNWLPAQVPGSGDFVTIDDSDNKDAVVTLVNPTRIASLALGNSVANSARLIMLNALQVSQSVTVSYNGEIQINSGTAVLATPSGDVKGTLTFNSGGLQGDYKVSGNVHFGDDSGLGQGAKIFTNAKVTHTGSNTVRLGGSLQLNQSRVTSTAGVKAAGTNLQLLALVKDESYTSPGFNWTA